MSTLGVFSNSPASCRPRPPQPINPTTSLSFALVPARAACSRPAAANAPADNFRNWRRSRAAAMLSPLILTQSLRPDFLRSRSNQPCDDPDVDARRQVFDMPVGKQRVRGPRMEAVDFAVVVAVDGAGPRGSGQRVCLCSVQKEVLLVVGPAGARHDQGSRGHVAADVPDGP